MFFLVKNDADGGTAEVPADDVEEDFSLGGQNLRFARHGVDEQRMLSAHERALRAQDVAGLARKQALQQTPDAGFIIYALRPQRGGLIERGMIGGIARVLFTA